VLLGDKRVEDLEPLAARRVEQVAAVEVEHVEEVRRDRHAALAIRLGGARRGLLEGPRPAVLVQGDRLAVEHELLRRE